MSLLLRKNHLLRCWGCLSLLNLIGHVRAYFICTAKTPSEKIGSLICSVKFLSPEVALYLCKSTIRPCMEHCGHVCPGAPRYSLEILDKLPKCICRTIGPALAACLEPVAHRRNIASLSVLYRYYLGRLSSELP